MAARHYGTHGRCRMREITSVRSKHAAARRGLSLGRIVAVAIAVALVIIVVTLIVLAAFHTDERSETLDAAREDERTLAVSDTASAEDSDSAVSIDEAADSPVVSFPLTEEGAQAALAALNGLEDSDLSDYPAVADAVAAFRARGYDASFVLFDFETGNTLVYGLDEAYYCASTIKAPFVAYVLESCVDGGESSLDDAVEEFEILGGSGVMRSDGRSSYTLEEVVEYAITFSDNTAYRLLWRLYGGVGFEQWASACGVDAVSWGGAEYPSFTALDFAKLWVGVARYAGGDAASASWFDGLLTRTETSFLRVALGENAVVRSKPGFDSDMWYSGDFDMGALHDGGIVSGETGSYLIAIMTDADYDSDYQTENEPLFESLAHALADVQASWVVS